MNSDRRGARATGRSGKELGERSAREVLEDHVRLREQARLDEDIERNYDADVVILSGKRALKGRDGVRDAARLLTEAVDPESYRYRTLMAAERIGFSEWSAEGEGGSIRDGVDSYLVENGKIRAQTIHYTVVSSELSMTSLGEYERVDRTGVVPVEGEPRFVDRSA